RPCGTLAATATTATAFAATTSEHLHLVGDDIGEVLLDTVLAGELVVADRTLDIDLSALLQVLAGDLAKLAEQLDPMPFDLLDLVAVNHLAQAGGRQAKRADGHTYLSVLHIRIVAKIADHDHLVVAACHGTSFQF